MAGASSSRKFKRLPLKKKVSEGEASVKEASGKAQESVEFGANLSSPNFFIFVSCP
jgi:hypothetical protein